MTLQGSKAELTFTTDEEFLWKVTIPTMLGRALFMLAGWFTWAARSALHAAVTHAKGDTYCTGGDESQTSASGSHQQERCHRPAMMCKLKSIMQQYDGRSINLLWLKNCIGCPHSQLAECPRCRNESWHLTIHRGSQHFWWTSVLFWVVSHYLNRES